VGSGTAFGEVILSRRERFCRNFTESAPGASDAQQDLLTAKYGRFGWAFELRGFSAIRVRQNLPCFEIPP
jgi:hypothetical protein